METISVKADKRTGAGKGPARRLRAQGKLPAVVYGPAAETIGIAVNPKDVVRVLNAPLGRNTVLTLDIEGKNQLALVKSFAYHPVTRELEHADFYMVALDRPVRVEVPFVTTGKSKGIAEGGILRVIFRKFKVECSPDKIPASIEADVTELGLGESLHVRELKLPAGVKVMLDPGQTVANVVTPEKEEKLEAAAPGAPAAAAAAAPAAAGKDAKAAAPAKDAKAAAPAKDAKKK